MKLIVFTYTDPFIIDIEVIPNRVQEGIPMVILCVTSTSIGEPKTQPLAIDIRTIDKSKSFNILAS